jgi:hypothetical protein
VVARHCSLLPETHAGVITYPAVVCLQGVRLLKFYDPAFTSADLYAFSQPFCLLVTGLRLVTSYPAIGNPRRRDFLSRGRLLPIALSVFLSCDYGLLSSFVMVRRCVSLTVFELSRRDRVSRSLCVCSAPASGPAACSCHSVAIVALA